MDVTHLQVLSSSVFGFDDLATIYITLHCIFPSEMEYDEDHPVCEKWNQPKNVH